MRKICLMILICALLLGLSCPVQAAQSGSCGEAVSWRFENGVLVLSGTGAMENYTDASRVPWWDLRDQILSVTVEEGITSVGDMSFAQCGKLTSVSLPDSLERIGKNAFWGCRKLENVVLPEKLTQLESGAFFQCASLGQISIPAGIAVLEQAVFAQCEHLDTVALHDGIVGIERDAFSRCYALKHLALPMGLERIETHAFFGCAQLQQLTFPQGFARIGEAPFYGCVSLKALLFLGSAPELHEKAFLDIEAEIFCSMHDRSWDTATQSGYGGNITWTRACFHEYTVTTTPPGCLTEGYSTFECSLCADSYRDLYIPALGHDFADYRSNGDATCTQDGTKTAPCTRCDATDTITDTGSAKGHAYGDWYVTKEAMCETEGQERRDCKNCDHYETRQIAAVGHNYTSGVTAPTCTEQGYTTHTCHCGDSYVDSWVDALGHDMGQWFTVTEATCTDDGSERRDCSRCDHSESRAIAATGHSHEAVVTEPTCTETGFTTHICRCGDCYVTDYTNPLGHSFTNYVSDGNATCTQDGTRTAVCDRCDATDTVIDPGSATGHDYVASVTEPTCTRTGYTIYTCRCGDSYVGDYTNPLGHRFTNYVSDGNATCTQDGTRTAVCDRCDATDTKPDVGSAHGHDFSGWTVVEEPTQTSDGLESRFCYHCGIEETQVIPRLENPFTDVPEGSFYHEPVLWAVAKGITNGTTATTFGPNDQCMRAHVVTFLWRAAGSPEPSSNTNPFVDVKETDFYYKAVLWAVEKGITNGLDATHFGPLSYCNRAQVVTFLWRAQGNPVPGGEDMPFTDVAAGSWYEAPILWAVENDITNGMSATSFGINTICNRAQIVTFLYRTYN